MGQFFVAVVVVSCSRVIHWSANCHPHLMVTTANVRHSPSTWFMHVIYVWGDERLHNVSSVMMLLFITSSTSFCNWERSDSWEIHVSALIVCETFRSMFAGCNWIWAVHVVRLHARRSVAQYKQLSSKLLSMPETTQFCLCQFLEQSVYST